MACRLAHAYSQIARSTVQQHLSKYKSWTGVLKSYASTNFRRCNDSKQCNYLLIVHYVGSCDVCGRGRTVCEDGVVSADIEMSVRAEEHLSIAVHHTVLAVLLVFHGVNPDTMLGTVVSRLTQPEPSKWT